jgi:hypothetical protein
MASPTIFLFTLDPDVAGEQEYFVTDVYTVV